MSFSLQKEGINPSEEEIKNEEVQITYFKWLFSNNINLSPMDAILKFTQTFKGSNLLVSQQISVIKGISN